MADDDDDRAHDPMIPESWHREPDVCGSCIAWRPEDPRPGDDVATGACRLRPELGRVPASLKLCNLYKPRGQFVYTPKKEAEPKRRKTAPPKVLRRSDAGELQVAEPRRARAQPEMEDAPLPATPYAPPPPPKERPPEETYAPPREIDLGQDANLPAVRATFRDLIREELGVSRREMAKRYKGGVVKVAKKEGPYFQHPVESLFSILDRLKASLDELERAVQKTPDLASEVHNVRKIRGSFTTFNVLWADREDYFTGGD
jgi:hypothetical protein